MYSSIDLDRYKVHVIDGRASITNERVSHVGGGGCNGEITTLDGVVALYAATELIRDVGKQLMEQADALLNKKAAQMSGTTDTSIVSDAAVDGKAGETE